VHCTRDARGYQTRRFDRRVGSIGNTGGQRKYHVQSCAALICLRLKTQITEVLLCPGETFCPRVGWTVRSAISCPARARVRESTPPLITAHDLPIRHPGGFPMPIAARSSARHVRRAVPGQSIAKRRESIAAFELWQRNWSTSLQGVDAVSPPLQAVVKRSDAARAGAHPR